MIRIEGATLFREGTILGVVVTALAAHRDGRGSLTETFRLDELPDGVRPVMGYVSLTEPGASRGPHEHREQTDVFAFLGPGTFLVALWDDRPGSSTRGCKMVLHAGPSNPLRIVIPPGVVHAYRNLSSLHPGVVHNFPDRLYAGWGRAESVDELRHEDREDLFYRDFIASRGEP